MDTSNVINPPEVNTTPKRGGFWKQLGMLVLGTTISLVLTFGTAWIIERHQRAKDRHLMALMVMSNIENFAQMMDEAYEYSARMDTLSTWMLSIPVDQLESLPDDVIKQIDKYFEEVIQLGIIDHDKTAENIFSNSIDTWKNINNVIFVENVGWCFSTMNFVEKDWNGFSESYHDIFQKILEKDQPKKQRDYTIKKLQNSEVRIELSSTHNRRCWLKYMSELLRYMNHQNMVLMNISEQELQAFTEECEKEIEIEIEQPNFQDFNTPVLDLDSLTTLLPIKSKVDSILMKQ